jgi:type II secretory pathway pseudopilin PulG
MLEMLVSMAVLSMLLVLLLSMVDNATKMWRQSENRVDAYREARAALNLIASDLASIYTSTNANFTYVNRATATVPTMQPHLDGKLFFVTALPVGAQGVDQKSDLCTVGYFAGYDKTSLTGKGEASMNLYRFFRPSNETFTALKTGDIGDEMSISTAPTSDDAEVLAKNITGFKVVAYSKHPTTAGKLTPFSQSATTPMPDVLEITLNAISNDAAKRFTSRAEWEDDESPTHAQHVRTFTKRVVLNRDASPTLSPSPTPSPTP